VPTDASLMRSIRYLALDAQSRLNARQIPNKGATDVVRTGEHRDMCLFTLLPQATDSGLQLFTREREFPKGHPQYEELLKDDKNWLDVHAQEGYLILNAGDMLDFMTQGLKDRKGHDKHIIATTHRVVGNDANLTRDRNSMPFFFHGNPLKPLINLQTGKPVVRDEKVYEGVPFDSTLQMTYRRLKRAGVVPAETSYPQFVEGFNHYTATVEKHIQDNGIPAAFHAGIPIE
jgi:isopenicillin N synthase-like dioxygenase